MAALLGMLTGIGGGMTRNLLLAKIPTVLRADLYAIAALLGAVVISHTLPLLSTAVTIAGAAPLLRASLDSHPLWLAPSDRPPAGGLDDSRECSARSDAASVPSSFSPIRRE